MDEKVMVNDILAGVKSKSNLNPPSTIFITCSLSDNTISAPVFAIKILSNPALNSVPGATFLNISKTSSCFNFYPLNYYIL